MYSAPRSPTCEECTGLYFDHDDTSATPCRVNLGPCACALERPLQSTFLKTVVRVTCNATIGSILKKAGRDRRGGGSDSVLHDRDDAGRCGTAFVLLHAHPALAGPPRTPSTHGLFDFHFS